MRIDGLHRSKGRPIAVNSLEDLFSAIIYKRSGNKTGSPFHSSSWVQKILQIYCCMFRTKHLIPTTRCHIPQPCKIPFAYAIRYSSLSPLLHYINSAHRIYIMERSRRLISTLHNGNEWRRERVLCENCFLMLILNFHVYWMSFMMVSCDERSVFATLYFLRVCNVIKKFDFRNLKLTPSRIMRVVCRKLWKLKSEYAERKILRKFGDVNTWHAAVAVKQLNAHFIIVFNSIIVTSVTLKIYVKHFVHLHFLALQVL